MGFIGDIKDAASMIQKADNIELYAKILDIQAQAMDMQEEIRKLKEENVELKKVKDIEEDMVRDCTTHIPYFTLKSDPNKIKYCATCWGLYGKFIQLSPANGTCPAQHKL